MHHAFWGVWTGKPELWQARSTMHEPTYDTDTIQALWIHPMPALILWVFFLGDLRYFLRLFASEPVFFAINYPEYKHRQTLGVLLMYSRIPHIFYAFPHVAMFWTIGIPGFGWKSCCSWHRRQIHRVNMFFIEEPKRTLVFSLGMIIWHYVYLRWCCLWPWRIIVDGTHSSRLHQLQRNVRIHTVEGGMVGEGWCSSQFQASRTV